ncbi:hypothetical protein FPV67DRAFT_1460906 [Lyophyllum atratum]|nr:hypothetical protein FPV67DRAFT_1460906 [Lyophyllum atratum]
MIASKLFAAVAFAIGVHASAINTQNTSAVTYVPVSPLGNVAAVELFGTRAPQTRLVYQDSTGAIVQYGITDGPFTTGKTDFPAGALVPASEPILRGTPIAFTAIGNADQGFHVYFLSPDRILKEYKWTAGVGGRYGNNCAECIDHMGFSVTAGRDFLYALENPTTNVLRVGFVSPGVPGTLVEAVKVNDASPWQLAPLPN